MSVRHLLYQYMYFSGKFVKCGLVTLKNAMLKTMLKR